MDTLISYINLFGELVIESHLNTLWQSIVITATVLSLLYVLKNIDTGIKSKILSLTFVFLFFLPIINSTYNKIYSSTPVETSLNSEVGSNVNGKSFDEMDWTQTQSAQTQSTQDPITKGKDELGEFAVGSEFLNAEKPQFVLPQWGKYILIFGAWAMLALILFIKLERNYTLLKKYETTGILPKNLQRIFAKLLAKHLPEKDVVLMMTDKLTTPVTVGFFQPVIYIPEELAKEITEKEFELVIYHELNHIRNKDYLRNFFELIVQSIYFFNPAIYLLKNRTDIEREIACDEYVLQNISKKRSYSETLLKIALYAETTPSAANAFNGKNNLYGRIKRINTFRNSKKGIFPKIELGLFIVIIAAMMYPLMNYSNIIALPNDAFSVEEAVQTEELLRANPKDNVQTGQKANQITETGNQSAEPDTERPRFKVMSIIANINASNSGVKYKYTYIDHFDTTSGYFSKEFRAPLKTIIRKDNSVRFPAVPELDNNNKFILVRQFREDKSEYTLANKLDSGKTLSSSKRMETYVVEKDSKINHQMFDFDIVLNDGFIYIFATVEKNSSIGINVLDSDYNLLYYNGKSKIKTGKHKFQIEWGEDIFTDENLVQNGYILKIETPYQTIYSHINHKKNFSGLPSISIPSGAKKYDPANDDSEEEIPAFLPFEDQPNLLITKIYPDGKRRPLMSLDRGMILKRDDKFFDILGEEFDEDEMNEILEKFRADSLDAVSTEDLVTAPENEPKRIPSAKDFTLQAHKFGVFGIFSNNDFFDRDIAGMLDETYASSQVIDDRWTSGNYYKQYFYDNSPILENADIVPAVMLNSDSSQNAMFFRKPGLDYSFLDKVDTSSYSESDPVTKLKLFYFTDKISLSVHSNETPDIDIKIYNDKGEYISDFSNQEISKNSELQTTSGDPALGKYRAYVTHVFGKENLSKMTDRLIFRIETPYYVYYMKNPY